MSRETDRFYEFGPFRLEPAERRLLHHGVPVEITPKALDTLLVLVTESGHLVGKDRLMLSVWPDRVVEEGNLTLAIHNLRKALSNGTEGAENYIETIPRQGYRFVARVQTGNQAEVTPLRQAPAESAISAGGKRDLRWVYAVAAFLVIVTATVLSYRTFRAPPSAQSLAVLPFLDLTPDSSASYLGDGISEEITTRLAQLPALRVAARTSAFQFKGKAVDVRVIGEKLRVGAVLEGSVARSGAILHITAQLIDTRNGYHIWSQSFDGSPLDLYRIQAAIVGATAQALKVPLAGEQQVNANRYDTNNPEAHDLYLRARYLWNQRSRGSKLEESIALFQQAVTKDPEYAVAYAGLADAYAVQAVNMDSAAPASQARAAALKALELNPRLAEPHATLGLIDSQVEWKFQQAEKEFETALTLKPDYAPAHHWRGLNLTLLGRFAEAEAELRAAQILDPQSLMVTDGLAENFYYWRRYDDAEAQAQQMLTMDPQMPAGLVLLAESEVEKKMYAEAQKVCDRFGAEPGMDALRMYYVALISEASGDPDRALRMAARLKGDSYSPSRLAGLYSRMNMPDRAFQLLNQAFDQHDPHFAYLRLDPLYDSLRGDDRYRNLVDKLERVEIDPQENVAERAAR